MGDVFACQGTFPSENQGWLYGMWVGGGPSVAGGFISAQFARRGGNLNRVLSRHHRHASFHEASCLDVIVPGVLRVPVGMIVMGGDLRDVIRAGWCSRPARAVERRVMDFGWRSGACVP